MFCLIRTNQATLVADTTQAIRTMPSTSPVNGGNTKAKQKKKADLEKEECGKCDGKFRPRNKTVQCTTCNTRYHKDCQNVSDTMYELLSDDAENEGIYWSCNICRKTTLGIIQKLSNLEIRLQAIESEKTNDQNKIKNMSNKIDTLEKTCQDLEKKIQLLVENNDKTLQTVSNMRRDLYNEHDKTYPPAI